jgi:hypothetical protein
VRLSNVTSHGFFFHDPGTCRGLNRAALYRWFRIVLTRCFREFFLGVQRAVSLTFDNHTTRPIVNQDDWLLVRRQVTVVQLRYFG